MTRLHIVSTVFVCTSLFTASAQTASDPAAAKPGIYAVDPAHTQVVFSVSHMGFTYYSGTFSNASGTLDLNSSDLSKTKLDIRLSVDSVSTTSSKLTSELKSAQWLDAGQFPEVTFRSNNVVADGANAATINGVLTLHGVTRPVTLKARYVGAGQNPLDKKYTVGFEGTTTIKRSDFGVKTYVPLIGDDVRLSLAGAFEKQD